MICPIRSNKSIKDYKKYIYIYLHDFKLIIYNDLLRNYEF